MLLVAALLSCLLTTGYAHISLTFPPARKYDLDFLGNSNSKAPCGMPKGSIKTTLLAGKPFNVTWHIAYPNKGGFRLQLLDKLERPVLDLTPVTSKSEYVKTDEKYQHYTVSIPSDYECEDCTIRLVREAKEWSNNDLFWSCADVDIKTKKTYKEDCSGHGPYLLSKCRCNRLYYGPRCQYRDECVDHTDCGDMGRCVDLHSLSAPRKQCYCELGWFGAACKKRSPLRNTEMDFSNYLYRELSPSFKLYWHILPEEQEIEIAMVANSTSYIGIGWRPSNITQICKNFPELNISQGENMTEPPSEPQVKSESRSTMQSEHNVQTTSNVSKVFDSQTEAEPSSTISSTFQTGTRKSFRPHRTLSSRATKDQDTPYSDFQPEVSSVTSVSYRVTSTQGASRGKRETMAMEGTSKEEKQNPVSEPHLEQDAGKKSVLDSKPEPILGIQATTETILKSSPRNTSKLNVEPELKDEPYKLESELETETESKLKFASTSESNPTSISTIQGNGVEKDIVFSKYTQQNDFSAMDCTDMVIGMARGTSFRIWDYYTRDRSTPKLDTFWGGKNDITAAMGFEKNGVTTIVFRKKLKGTEMTDHSIENSLMHVVWAHGQGQSHDTKSGDISAKNFYKDDELQYHGRDGQRGVASINFFEEAETPSVNNGETTTTLSFCQGEWSYPKNCDLKKRECEYHASWNYVANKGHIQFSISTTNTQLWTGIAFSNDHKMAQTDAIIGWVDKSGRPFMMDTWIVGHTAPLLDESQDIFNITGKTNDGVTTLTFLRKRDTGDTKKDFSFTDNNCLYMMFPVKGGDYNPVNKKIRKHKAVPSFSSAKVCIKACSEGDEPTTPPPPPHVNYNIEIKVINLGENYKAPRPNTDEFEILSNTIFSGLKNVRKISGFRNLQITEFKQEKDNIIAAMDLEVDQEQNERGRSLDESDSKIRQVVQSIVSSGKVGTLTLDPSFLVFQPVQTSWTVNSEETQKTTLLSVTKLWVVIGCIIALLVVAVMQAGCTIYKTMNSTSSKHKDALTFNSAWKDYSTANTNYAFEPFESDEKQPNSLGQSNGSSRSTVPLHKPISAHPMVAYHANGSQYADTRSLQRPKGYHQPMERSTYSLPRTQPQPPQGYYTHRSARNNGDQLQPDFYFMPSQRKYSGMLQT